MVCFVLLVLCGRGGGIYKHLGNQVYRRIVDHNKDFYKTVPKRHRMLVSQSIVQTILTHGGRFLQQQSSQNEWKEIEFRRAVQKTSQALREQKNDDIELDPAALEGVIYEAERANALLVDSVFDELKAQGATNGNATTNNNNDNTSNQHGSSPAKSSNI